MYFSDFFSLNYKLVVIRTIVTFTVKFLKFYYRTLYFKNKNIIKIFYF